MLTMTNVASDRIGSFLSKSELDKSSITYGGSSEEKALAIENGNFSYKTDGDAVLSDVNINVKKGQIVAVVGPVGCGKSSMVSAFLGELQSGYEYYLGDRSIIMSRAKEKICGLKYFKVKKLFWVKNVCGLKNILRLKNFCGLKISCGVKNFLS